MNIENILTRISESVTLSKRALEIIGTIIREEAEESSRIDNAMHYLCDSDELTIENQITAIENHPNDDDFIDNVDGVIVWDKLVNSITCREFIELI